MKSFLTALVALIAAPVTAKGTYVTVGKCDGLPRVQLTTPRGVCVGLVAEHLGFPRGLALIGRDVYVADLASRTPGRGRILRAWRLRPRRPGRRAERLEPAQRPCCDR